MSSDKSCAVGHYKQIGAHGANKLKGSVVTYGADSWYVTAFTGAGNFGYVCMYVGFHQLIQ